MAPNHTASPELQPGLEDSTEAPHSVAQHAVLRPNVQAREASAAPAPVAQTLAAPRAHLATPDKRLSKSRQSARTHSQANAMPRQPTETQAQPHYGFASKTHRVLH